MYITVNGTPLCDIVDYSRLSDEQRRKHTPTCGHSDRERAEADAELVRSMYPDSTVEVTEGGCPSSAEQWDDYVRYAESLERRDD